MKYDTRLEMATCAGAEAFLSCGEGLKIPCSLTDEQAAQLLERLGEQVLYAMLTAIRHYLV